MKEITLSDLGQDDFNAAAETVVSGIRAYNRKLDTRDGTVLRDLLVNPSAAIDGVVRRQIEEARKVSSLKLLKEAQDAGESVDQADVDAILANFNITPHAGTPAQGLIKVIVADGTVAYSVAAGTIFSTADGIEFASDEQVVASSSRIDNPGIQKTAELYEGTAGFFFLVPATAVEPGSSGNITQGNSLTPVSRIPSFVMSEAYKDFCGGSDTQPLDEVIRSIPTGLSIRGFVNRTAIEGMLRAEFDAGKNPIVAVSAVGYGNDAQRRDRHNVFGVSVGGRVDVYVRNFTDLYTETRLVYGTRIPSTKEDDPIAYRIPIGAGVFAGPCWIKSVSDPSGSGAEGEEVLGSLAFAAVRNADTSGTWHDFDRKSQSVEAFNTVWQGFDVTVENTPPLPVLRDGDEEYPAERAFKVTAYCLPEAEAIQAFVDGDGVRSIATDVVVRCPIVCMVNVNAVVKYDPRNPLDEENIKEAIRAYVNGRGFVGRLTRSEIVQILKNAGAVSVEMPNQDMLTGELVDAKGRRHVLSGDALDITSIKDGEAMMTKDTVVFCLAKNNIQIKFTPNS